MDNNVWTKQQKDFITNNFKHVNSSKEMARLFNNTFKTNMNANSIRKKCNRMGLSFKDKGLKIVENLKQTDVNKAIKGMKEQEILDRMLHMNEENTFLRKQVGQYEKIDELDRRILKRLDEFSPNIPKYSKMKKKKFNDSKSVEDAMLCIGDIHFSEMVNKEEMRGINSYNARESAIRIQYIVDSTINIIKNKLIGYDIKNLWVALLGDIVSGDIHSEIKETNETPTLEASILIADMLSCAIKELAEYFNVNVFGVVGNHGRLTKKPPFKRKFNNLDWLVYKIIEKDLKDIPNAVCNFSKALFEIKTIKGFKYLFSHGDGIRSNLGMPWYGLGRVDSRMTGALLISDDQYHSAFYGHFHQPAMIPRSTRGRIYINGSVIGANEFSLGSIHSATPPCQLLCGLHNRNAVTWNYLLDLSDASKEIKNLRYHYTMKE